MRVASKLAQAIRVLIAQEGKRGRILLALEGFANISLGLSPTAVAAEMGTSQSAIARIESGKADIKLSTIERYAATLGRKVEWRVASAASARSSARGTVRAASGRRASVTAQKASRH